jgi:hypothetical protein
MLGEKEVEVVPQRPDRITHDEAQTTAVQTLEVVYGPVQNLKVVMEGEQVRPACNAPWVEHHVSLY